MKTMHTLRSTVLCLLAALAASMAGAQQPPAPVESDEAQNPVRVRVTQLKTAGSNANDEMLARRLYEALLGRPPRRSEIDAFLNGAAGERTEILVDRLLKSSEYMVKQAGRRRDIGQAFSSMYSGVIGEFTLDTTGGLIGMDLNRPLDAHSLLGLSVEPADETMRAQLGLPKDQGLVVNDVIADSPAAVAGILVHDTFLKLNDTPLASEESLRGVLQKTKGAEVAIELVRAGQRKSVTVKPKAPGPDASGDAIEATLTWAKSYETQNVYYVGIQVDSLSPALRSQLQLLEGEGVVVGEVYPDTPAARDGLKEHDVLLSLAGEPLHAPDDVKKHLQKSGDKPVEFKLLRAGNPQTITVTPTTRKEPKVEWENELMGSSDGKYMYWSVAPPIHVDISGRVETPTQPEELSRQLETLSQQLEALRSTVDALRNHIPHGDEQPAEK